MNGHGAPELRSVTSNEPLNRSDSGLQSSSDESSNRSLDGKPGSYEARRAYARLRDTIIKSAAIGFSLRGGLSALSVLLSQLSKRKRQAKRSGEHIRSLLVDAGRFAAFLAAFGGTYVAVDEGLCYCAGRQRSKNWRAAVAGACAAPTILLTGSGSHAGLASYIFLRGLLLLVRCANKPGTHPLLRASVALSRWEHSDTLLMCLASSQILPSWLVAPETLPGSYVRFLNTQGGKKQHVYDGLREWAGRQSTSPSPLKALSGIRKLAGAPISRPCEFAHPGMSCSQHAITQLPANFRRAMSVYIPVYVVPALLVHRNNILKQPLDISSKVAKGIVRSSLFLAVYVALAWRGACVVHKGRSCIAPGTVSTPALYALTVWSAGIATLIEKKSRRLELAMYCMSRALVSFMLSLAEGSYLPRAVTKVRGDVVVFAIGLAAITHCYSDGEGRHRDVFKSKYLSVLDFVFGNSGFSRGAIRHVPSSQVLLHQLFLGRPVGLGGGRRSFSTGSLPQAANRQRRELQPQEAEVPEPPSPAPHLDVEQSCAASARMRPPTLSLYPPVPRSEASEHANSTLKDISPGPLAPTVSTADFDPAGRRNGGLASRCNENTSSHSALLSSHSVSSFISDDGGAAEGA